MRGLAHGGRGSHSLAPAPPLASPPGSSFTQRHPGWHGSLADPEGHPGHGDQQHGGHVGLDDVDATVPAQLEVQAEPRELASCGEGARHSPVRPGPPARGAPGSSSRSGRLGSERRPWTLPLGDPTLWSPQHPPSSGRSFPLVNGQQHSSAPRAKAGLADSHILESGNRKQ